MSAADLQGLESKLGHTFRDRSLLVRALTHRSFAFGQRSTEPLTLDNERLEFLGDSILGFLISECLVLRHTSWPEGQLSKTKAHLVSATHLHRVAQRLGIGEFLQLGRSEEMSGGRQKKMLLANAVEAIIAALHIDGGMEKAREFVIEHVLGGGDLQPPTEEPENNYKSTLQERAQAIHLPQPQYVIVEETGPGHAKTFLVEARIGTAYRRQGSGPSKKAAAQNAAKAILEEMDAAVTLDPQRG
ncbi:MAG TPA: ribonuclease III [Bryobacteraceae bacterium]|nr:ribonuclease III [Bryobacteraceae bacterium]